MEYSPMGELLKVTRLAGTAQALETQFTYEPIFHQLATIEDPLHHVTTFSYDPDDPAARATECARATNGALGSQWITSQFATIVRGRGGRLGALLKLP